MNFATEAWMDPPMVGTLALVPQIAAAVRIPVIAAGGIMDGRGIAAALALGAAGAQLGPRFLLASEAAVFRAYRERLLTAQETDTVLTRAFSGRLTRSLSNRFVEHLAMQGAAPLPWPHQACIADDIFRAAAAQNNADWAPLYAGQGLGLAQQVEPAAEIVAHLAQELQGVLTHLRGHETAWVS